MDTRVFSLILATIVVACGLSSSVASGNEPDKIAGFQALAAKQDKPLLVLMGAPWCSACVIAERSFATQLQESGVYVKVDVDRDPVFRKQLPHVAYLPALVVYERDGLGGWLPPKVVIGVEAIGTWLRLRVVRPLLRVVR